MRAFLRQRLGFGVADYADEVADALPVELDSLETWQVGQRLLDARLAGASEDAAVAAERARGELPPGVLADPVLAKLRPTSSRSSARADVGPDGRGARSTSAFRSPTAAGSAAPSPASTARCCAASRTRA